MDVYRDSDLRKMNPGLVAVKVYIASNSRHAPRWSVLRAAGVPFISTWIDWPFNTLPVLLILRPLLGCAHWTKCCEEAAAADILLFVDLPGETQCGALIEMGCAVGSGVLVFIVSQETWSV